MKQVFASGLAAAAIAIASVAAAEPPPFRDFTFKRVKPPAPGAPPRITVQIEPSLEPDPPPAPAAGEDKTAITDGAFAWYWNVVRPELSEASPGRLEPALAGLLKGPGPVPAPRLAHLQKIAAAHGTHILTATVGTKVSPALVLAVIGIESSGRVNAVSPAGAAGLMQLMPATAKRFGTEDITDPEQNIRGGVAYLDWLMGEFDNDPVLVLAGYNAGEGAVAKHDGVPPYDETRAYVPKVLAAWNVARGLCKTPPVLISDGCVFAVPGNTGG